MYISSLEFKNVAGRKFSPNDFEVSMNIAYKQKQVVAVDDVSKLIISPQGQDLINELEIKSFMTAPMFLQAGL